VVPTPGQALERLEAGNARYAEGHPTSPHFQTASQRQRAVEGQEPFATILACADSRVPPELVFDQSCGELFVVRTAGHAVTPVVTGSVEYALTELGVPLVLVLGHSGCGAVKATLDEMASPSPRLTPGLAAVVECVRPGLEPLSSRGDLTGDALVATAVRANVAAALRRLRDASSTVREYEQAGRVRLVGAEYGIGTGWVTLRDPRE
jgi:carbonic anhydrase